mgnify:CR=1 FL=1
MNAPPVVVSGFGPVSAIGCGRDTFWDALTAGKHGFGPMWQRWDVSATRAPAVSNSASSLLTRM